MQLRFGWAASFVLVAGSLAPLWAKESMPKAVGNKAKLPSQVGGLAFPPTTP